MNSAETTSELWRDRAVPAFSPGLGALVLLLLTPAACSPVPELESGLQHTGALRSENMPPPVSPQRDPDGHNHAEDGREHGEDEEDEEEIRREATRRVSWRKTNARCSDPVAVKILGFNDFHGQLSTGRLVAGRPVGGAAVMAAYLKAAQLGKEERTFIAHAGDHVGASPAASALLQDEPSIAFLNLLANEACPHKGKRQGCNLIGTLGNHEFDEGRVELLRLLDGGNHAKGPFLEDPWRGAAYPTVSANVVSTKNSKPLLQPFLIRRVGTTRIGFVGATLRETPSIVTPTGVAGLIFQDEAEAINRAVEELNQRNVHTIVVLIHQGGPQSSYTGATNPAAPGPAGAIAEIVNRLHDDVDLVISGHAHAFTNALLKTAGGKDVLVTQAFSASTAYADIDLQIDPRSGDVISKSASIVTTWGDEGPGLTPDSRVEALVTAAEEKVAPLVNQVIGTAPGPITRVESPAGESAMGNLIADAQRAATGSSFTFMNPGGIRADLAGGNVTWGALFTVQPFGNSLVKMTLTGQDLYDLLNQQWAGQPFPRILKTSGLSYTWSLSRPLADRIVEISAGDGTPIDRAASYSVTVNNFLASGGDNFTVLTRGTNLIGGDVDLDALINYVVQLPQPFNAVIEGRIQQVP